MSDRYRPRFLAAPFFAAVLLAALAVAATGPVRAASVISSDPQRGVWAWCAGAGDPLSAMQCAVEACEAAGGQDCGVEAGCPEPGHGAVAAGPEGALHGVCGRADADAARSGALEECPGCEIVESFSEAEGSALAQGSGRGTAAPPAPAPLTAPAVEAPAALQTAETPAAAEPEAAPTAAPEPEAPPAAPEPPAPTALTPGEAAAVSGEASEESAEAGFSALEETTASAGSGAAAVVTADIDSGIYGLCEGQESALRALVCATQACASQGGENCAVIAGCPDAGVGAVAKQSDGPAVGASCGQPDEAQARSVARQRCDVLSESGGPCEVVRVFGAAVERPGPATETAASPDEGGPTAEGSEADADVPAEAPPLAPEVQVSVRIPGDDEERIAFADRFVGRWSNVQCAERFWEITRVDDLQYKVLFWYLDIGVAGEEMFTVSFDGHILVLLWDTENPNPTAEERNYVEQVINLREDGYEVVDNNYRPHTGWLVQRCRGGGM